MSTYSHDDVSRVMHRCVNDGIDPIAAANKIKGLVVRSPSEYEFSAFDKIWSEAIAMAKSWEVMDERHGRLANLFAELSRLRDSRFQVADFWLHACGKQIYASGQAVLDNESGQDICEAFQFPQAPTGSTLPMPLRCQFRHTKAQLIRSWRAWEFLFRSYAGRAAGEEAEEGEEERRLLGLARGMLEYMEMVESEYERAVHGDLGAMEAMSSFAGV
ncbi:unnamed protein product [Clonostachys rhizophaga]|uniref:Uncharacterized protein n=1 Tax=Clonostachys rhizophaga TaxID=160324 RepID=A0A9N9VV46_9HYPO|nr:unnamed protein product [Clonostachys rhizophaga]